MSIGSQPTFLSDRGIKWEHDARAVAFDLDDTLYPEREYVYSGFQAVAEWVGVECGFSEERVFREIGEFFESGDRRKIFDSWAASHHLPPSIVTDMVRVYRCHTPNIRPYPGIVDLLTEISGGYQLGLLTDGYLEGQRNKLKALDLERYFDIVVFTDELGRDSWKPSTRPFLKLIEALSLRAEQIVYVGDNPSKDFIACRRLGMPSIWFHQIEGTYSHILPSSEEHNANYRVETIAELRSLLVE